MTGPRSKMLNFQTQSKVDENTYVRETSGPTEYLIDQYEKAKQLLESLLNSDEPPMIEDISRADHAVKSAFDELVATDLYSAEEIAKRAKYLLTIIRQNLDSDSLVERLALAIDRGLTQLTDRTENG